MAHRTNAYPLGNRFAWDCQDCDEADIGFEHLSAAVAAACEHQRETD